MGLGGHEERAKRDACSKGSTSLMYLSPMSQLLQLFQVLQVFHCFTDSKALIIMEQIGRELLYFVLGVAEVMLTCVDGTVVGGHFGSWIVFVFIYHSFCGAEMWFVGSFARHSSPLLI